MSNSRHTSTRIFRLLAALKRHPAALWQRQAAKRQTGSNSPRRNAIILWLEALGLSLRNSILFDAAGESGRGPTRPVFDELVARVKTGEFGAVITSAFDSLGSDEGDTQRLYDAAAATATLIVIGDGIYDPSDRHHRMLLNLQSILTRWNHERRCLTTRMARNKSGFLYRVDVRGRSKPNSDEPDPSDPDKE